MKTTLNPTLLRWARERADLSAEQLAHKMGIKKSDRVLEWEKTGTLSVEQIETLAQKTHTPFGYLFLSEPPHEEIPIKDFRRGKANKPPVPKPDLLDIIYHAIRCQSWYRDYLIDAREEPLAFAGSTQSPDSKQIVATANSIRQTLGITTESVRDVQNWRDAYTAYKNASERAGIIIMESGQVGSNTHRVLDPTDFKGFALSDKYAPLVFINAKDFVASKTFTLAHELAHIWIGDSGLSNLETSFPEVSDQSENFCNAVAAEFLVPSDSFLRAWNTQAQLSSEIARLTQVFKVSSLVIARKALDAKLISRDEFFKYYEDQIALFAKHRAEQKAKQENREKKGGPSYYKQKEIQIGSRLSLALVQSAQSGKTLIRDAMRLLYISSTASFDAFAGKLFAEPDAE